MSFGASSLRFVPAVFALLVVAACGGDGGGAPQGGQPTSGPATGDTTTTTTSAPGGPTTTGTAAPGAGTRIAVTETEFSIRLPSATLTPGPYTFAVDNTGAATHDLVIKGPGVDSARTNLLKKGDKGEIAVTLQPGSYELWCSVGNHRSRGMQTTISVG